MANDAVDKLFSEDESGRDFGIEKTINCLTFMIKIYLLEDFDALQKIFDYILNNWRIEVPIMLLSRQKCNRFRLFENNGLRKMPLEEY